MDARQMCGHDVRRSGIWPTDSARLEAFIQQHGGTVEASPIGNVGVMLRWCAELGNGVVVTGQTTQDAIVKLRESVERTNV